MNDPYAARDFLVQIQREQFRENHGRDPSAKEARQIDKNAESAAERSERVGKLRPYSRGR